ncbi:MAG: TldD/PmbA family protein [Clostridia bacterium]|nr:TldD/PmbA family protein [Clostridia bacterium]
MISHTLAQEVLAAALTRGGHFADLFLEDTTHHGMMLRGGKVETANTSRLHGAGVRVFAGDQFYYVYTNDTGREGLLRCARRAADAVSSSDRGAVTPPRKLALQDIHPVKAWPGDVEGAKAAAKLREASLAARAVSPEITQVTANYIAWDQNVAIFNTEGVAAEDRRVYTRLVCVAVASNGAENQTGYTAPGARMGFELFDLRVDPAKAGEHAARQAVTMLHAPECPAGVMPVVIENGFGGVIFHEACGHSLEATSVSKGMSEFCGKLGMQIAAPCVSAMDDGLLPNEWGSIAIDDEGTPAGNLVLIENGVLKNYLTDRYYGGRMNAPSTGSGRRQSYAFAPCARMRNTYIAAGQDCDEEMIATMGDGLYAAAMGGGSVNPTTGEFNFAVDEGYLVKGGKIAHPVRGASLIGRGAEVLQRIDRVGRHMRMAQGMCGSLSGSVPTNVGQPRIRVSSMTVGGK